VIVEEALRGPFKTYLASPDSSALIKVGVQRSSSSMENLVEATRSKLSPHVNIVDAGTEQWFGLEIGKMHCQQGDERLLYYLPAGDEVVVAVLVTASGDLDRWRPVFDATLQDVQGLRALEPRISEVEFGLGLLGGALFGTWLKKRRRRRVAA
jgi:hypothetical protein